MYRQIEKTREEMMAVEAQNCINDINWWTKGGMPVAEPGNPLSAMWAESARKYARKSCRRAFTLHPELRDAA